MRVLSAAEMREADRQAIEDYGIPALVLMENAALKVVAALEDVFDDLALERVAVVAGRGNNGGDGLAIARHLHNRGASVEVYLLGRIAELAPGPSRTNAEILGRMDVPLSELTSEADLPRLEAALEGASVVVDALLGTGLSRPAEGLYARAIELVTTAGHAGSFVLAVDLPSGLDSDTGLVTGPAVEADLTVSFGAAKLCVVLPPAAEHVGQLVVADISIPPRALNPSGPAVTLVDADLIAALLPTREPASHKGTYGHVLGIAGSRGKSGAAALVGAGALRAGAGLVTLATAASVRAEVAHSQSELMTHGLAETPAGGLAEAALAELVALADSSSAVALGPGLGASPDTGRLVRALVAQLTAPCVIDADGLNAFGADAALMAGARGSLVLTPHPGEAARLCGTTTAQVQADRIGTVRALAARAGAIVILKGHLSLIATPTGDVYVNPTGNPGMASAGMGDVLTGIVAALLGQGLEPLHAALVGAYLHGLAGDIAVRAASEESLIASDLLGSLGAAFRELRSPQPEAQDARPS